MGLKLDQFNKEPSAVSGRKTDLDSLLKKEIKLFGSSFGSKKKEQFYTELSVLLTSGIRLKDALYLLAESQKKKEGAQLFRELGDGIVAGSDFSDLLDAHKHFSTYETHSVKIGEQSGALERVTQSLSDFYSRKNEQRRNLVSALTYPAIVLTTALLAVLFMLQFVVPMFKDVFSQNNVELPAITKGVIVISETIGTYGWILLILIMLPIVSRRFFKHKFWYRNFKDKLLLRIPGIGRFIRTSNIARFTQAVALLVSTKVSIPQSIHLAKEMIDFIPLERALEQVETAILRGSSLSDSLKAQKFFDPKMIALVRVAEETNETEFVFNRLNEQYNQEVLQQSKLFSTVLEPVIILIVGMLVAVILIAMYLPMFELGNVLK